MRRAAAPGPPPPDLPPPGGREDGARRIRHSGFRQLCRPRKEGVRVLRAIRAQRLDVAGVRGIPVTARRLQASPSTPAAAPAAPYDPCRHDPARPRHPRRPGQPGPARFRRRGHAGCRNHDGRGPRHEPIQRSAGGSRTAPAYRVDGGPVPSSSAARAGGRPRRPAPRAPREGDGTNTTGGQFRPFERP